MCKIGKVYVIGLGPGAEKEMTYQASTALEKSEVIIGYTVYTGLIRERFPDKSTFPHQCGRKWSAVRWQWMRQ